MSNRRKRTPQKMTTVAHYMVIDGVKVEVNPHDPATGIPDLCKWAWLEMTTGQPHKIVKPSKGRSGDSQIDKE